MKRTEKRLISIYKSMFARFGPQGWWPAETDFECVVGTILTQNTSWKNAEKAISRMKSGIEISVRRVDMAPVEKIAEMIRPSGYFNQKARRLKVFARFIMENYNGDLNSLLAQNPENLRKILLSIEGIGRETADSIALYAGGHPLFVVDAYTRRIFSRHGLIGKEISYDEIQSLFARNLPNDAGLFNEYHALIVATAKNFCHKSNPDCGKCPLERDLLEYGN